MMNFGVVAEDATLNIYFTTAAADGGEENFSATIEQADITIYKDGSAMTLDASTITPSNVATGVQKVVVDLSNDADFTTGSHYVAVLDASDETIDSQAVSGVLAYWYIESSPQQANRLLGEAIYPSGVTISTTTGNTNTPNSRINLTDVHDAQTADADLVGARYLVLDQGTGQAVEAIAYSVQSARLFNFRTAAAGEDLDFIVAAGDYVIFLGHGITTRIDAAENGSVLTEAGGNGDHLTEAGGDGDHLTEAGGDGDHLTALATAAQVSGLQVQAGSALSQIAESYTLTTGTQSSGTVADSRLPNGTTHEHTDTAGTLDLYYQFDIGSIGRPSNVEIIGRLSGANDSLTVYAYDWAGTAWEQIGTLTGKAGTDNDTVAWDLLVKHVGTGANVGKVRVRFEDTGLSSATLVIDRIQTMYLESVQGVANGSTITLAATTNNENYTGNGWVLALGGQDIGSSYFYGAKQVTGTGTNANGSEPVFDRCLFGGPTLSADQIHGYCVYAGTMTLTSTAGVTADVFSAFNCDSAVAGSSAPHFDFSGVTKTTNIQFRKWSGGIELTLTSDCTMSLDVVSGGTVTVNGTGGSLFIRGAIEGVTDNSSGSVTIDTDGVTARNKDGGRFIRAAAADIPILMVDSTDHVSPEPSLTVSVQVSKDGGAFGNIAGTVANEGNGMYTIEATAADMTGDVLIFRATATGADATEVTVFTRPVLVS